MCGIVGFLSDKSGGMFDKDLSIFEQMLFSDTLRGKDSTGVFTVNTSGRVKGCKSAQMAPDFLRESKYGEVRQWAVNQGRAIIGHNRAATKGSVVDENAHPFREGAITLVHNGTLWHGYQQHVPKDSKVDVDSHAICHILNEHGVDQVEEAINKIEGAYALVWFDSRDSSLNFLRNKERPLYHCRTEDGMYWASEDDMLVWILGRNDKKIIDGPHQLPEHTHSKFKYAKGTWDVSNKKVAIYPKAVAVHVTPASVGKAVHHGILTPEFKEWAEQYRDRPTHSRNYGSDECSAFDSCGDDNWPRRNARMQQHSAQLLQMEAIRKQREAREGGVARAIPILYESEKTLIEQCGRMSTSLDFMSDVKTIDGHWVRGHCVDFNRRNRDNINEGVFLYALPAQHTAIIRCYIPYDKEDDLFENTMLEACMSSVPMEFKIQGKHWHKNAASQDAIVPNGYGLYYAADARDIPRILTKEKETLQ